MGKRTRGIRKKLKQLYTAAAVAVLIVTFLLSAVLLAGKYCRDQSGKEEYRLIRKIAGISENRQRYYMDSSHIPAVPDENGLLQINPDYAGWLFIPGTEISYPVVYPENNYEYLNQTFEGKENACGCLFFEASYPPFSSENTVIYGHNMKSGEMFGTLKKYREEDFFRQNKTIYLWHEGQWSMYQVQMAYLTDRKDKSPYEAGKEASEKMRLTLATCHGKEQRLIVQAEKQKNFLTPC